MTIKTKISFKEYRRLLFSLVYKKPIMKIIVGVGIAMIIWILGYYLNLIPVPKPEIYQYITLILIMIVQPTVIYWTIKRNYESSNHLGEQLEIHLTETEINIQGESFYTKIASDKIFKVDEEPCHFLFYQNTLSAIIISKKVLDCTESKELRRIISAIPNVPKHLDEND